MSEMVAIIDPGKKRKRKEFDDTSVDLPKHPMVKKQEAQMRLKKSDVEHPLTAAGRFLTVEDNLADDCVYYRNEKVACLEAQFPYDKDMIYVDRYYPHAKCGPLYIDSPATRAEQSKCEQKAHVMLDAGLKYAFILPGEFLEDVIKRMGHVLADHSRRGA